MALSQITAKTKITASTLNGVINAVNSLQTANSTAYITKTWVSGTSWYRVWSDGWIEQGGTLTNGWSDTAHTISLHTGFTTTTYNVLVSCTYNGESKWVSMTQAVTSKTKTSFTCGKTSPKVWYACGR